MDAQVLNLFEALEAAPEGVVLWDADGRLVMCNEKFRQMHHHIVDVLEPGLKIEELLRRQKLNGARAILEPCSTDWVEKELDQRKRNIIPDVVTRYGDQWFQLRRKKLTDGSIIAFHTDITDIKKSEEIFRKVFESGPALMSVSTVEDGVFLDVNEVWLKTLGYKKSEVIGKTRYDLDLLVDPEARSLVTQSVEREGRENTEIQFKTKSGEVCYLLVGGERIEFDGRDCYLFISQNVTQQKLDSAALEQSENRFRDFAKSAADRFWETDRNHKYIYVSQATRRFKAAPSKLIGKAIWENLSGRTGPELLDTLESTFKKCESFHELHLSWRGFDGNVRYARLNGIAIFDDAGHFSGYRGTTIDETEEVQARLQAQEQEERFRRSFEESQIGMTIVETSGQIRLANQAFCDMLGYFREELQTKTLQDITHPGDAESVENDRNKLITGEYVELNREKRYLRKDGSTVWGLVSRSVITDVEGSPLYTIGQIQDISKRKEVEKSLSESEQALRSHQEWTDFALGTAKIGTWQWNIQDDTHFWDDNMKEMFGLSSEFLEEFSAEQFFKILHPEDIERVKKAVSESIDGKGNYDMDYRVIWPDGSVHWINSRADMHRDVDGNSLRKIGACVDITERKTIQLKLEESEERFRRSFEDAQIGMTMVEPDGQFRLVNQAFCDMLGYTIEELQAKNVGEITYPGDTVTTIEKRKDSISRDDPENNMEKRYLHKDGSIIWALISRSVVTDDFGHPIYTIGQIQDITVRKEAEDTLRHAKELAESANRTKSEFLTNISHELRTPLNAILGYGQLLQENPKEALSSVQEKHIEKLLSSGRHLKDLINDILDLTKFEAGIMTISSGRVAPQDVIDESTLIVSNLVQDAGINLTNNTPNVKMPEIWADRMRVRQALVNILSNAVKYNSKNGKIILDSELLDNGLLRISVADTGSGIPVERQNEIFLPFTRLNGNNADVPGAGIGLTITKHLVEAMGGKIDFKSDRRGSTFWIDLPLVDAGNRDQGSGKTVSKVTDT